MDLAALTAGCPLVPSRLSGRQQKWRWDTKKKIVGACEACEPIQSPPPLIFPRFIRLAGKFACFLRTLA